MAWPWRSPIPGLRRCSTIHAALDLANCSPALYGTQEGSETRISPSAATLSRKDRLPRRLYSVTAPISGISTIFVAIWALELSYRYVAPGKVDAAGGRMWDEVYKAGFDYFGINVIGTRDKPEFAHAL